ncbi:hypothetical protein V8B97DRAFT_2022502 [Scleroderma yunnanense]
MATIYNSLFIQGFTIHALLRHGAHKDGAHYHTKSPSGLHPAYFHFNFIEDTGQKRLSRSALTEARVGDVFDAITVQDQLDSGISLLIRCPGFDVQPNVTANKIPMDHVSSNATMLVQEFCQEFAIPHLQCFVEWCKVESIKALRACLITESITLLLTSHIQCMGLNMTAKAVQSEDMRHLSPSAAIQESAMVPPSPKQTQPKAITTLMSKVQFGATPKSFHQCHQCCFAEAFPLPEKEILLDPISVELSDTSVAGPVLISNGPNSDAVLDQFGLGNNLLSQLHTLIRTAHSSHWEVVLRFSPWNLTGKQASNLCIQCSLH